MAACSTSFSSSPPLVEEASKTTESPNNPSAQHSGSSFVFSIHSDPLQPDPLPSDQSRSHDKFAHTRTKRKRTSPEDFAILEAEYQKNSRPDKATRNDIVRCVSLSEKEVQIWFQNRRQMTRRKCRTWQPNEITSIIRSSQEASGREGSPSNVGSSSSQLQSSQASEPAAPSTAEEEESLEPQLCDITKQTNTQTLVSPEDADGQDTASRSRKEGHESEAAPLTLDAIQHPRNELSQKSAHAPTKDKQDELRMKSPIRDYYHENHGEQAGNSNRQSFSVESPRKRGKRASSIRLSMSLDGKAQVIMGGNTPSPPSKSQTIFDSSRRSGGLQRSQSSISPGEKGLQDITDIPPRPPLRTHGRSRDARTWEFYCDSDGRDALTKTAEHQQKGSALGAIQLIRSGSAGRGPLIPSAQKQNSQLQRQDSEKRKSVGERGKKTKLARTTSSYARLQGTTASSGSESKGKDSKPSSQPALWEEPGGDSDKENWEPGTQSSRHRGRPTGSRALGMGHGKVLEENTHLPSHSSSFASMMAREGRKRERRQKQKAGASDEGKENVAVDEEVAAFMGESGMAGEEDELDAVQNLLSLSQGAWQ